MKRRNPIQEPVDRNVEPTPEWLAILAETLPPFLTREEVAKLLRLSVDDLARRGWRGEGPATVKLSPGKSGAIRYPTAGLLRWLRERAGNGAADAGR